MSDQEPGLFARLMLLISSGQVIRAGDRLILAGCEVIVFSSDYTLAHGKFNWIVEVIGMTDCLKIVRDELAFKTEGEFDDPT